MLVAKAFAEQASPDIQQALIDKTALPMLLGAIAYLAKTVHHIVVNWKVQQAGHIDPALLVAIEQFIERDGQVSEAMRGMLTAHTEILKEIQIWQSVQTKTLDAQLKLLSDLAARLNLRGRM